MAKKTTAAKLQSSTNSQSQDSSGKNNDDNNNHVTITIPSNTRTKNILILFIRGAMMRVPFLLMGCVVLWALKEYGILPTSSIAEKGLGEAEEKRPLLDFSVMQVFAVNVVSEACVKVWMRILREKENEEEEMKKKNV